jgi:hypothetical protein
MIRLNKNSKSIMIIFIFCLVFEDCFPQSKKVQIANLTYQIDSLNQVIESKNEIIKANSSSIADLLNKENFFKNKLFESQKTIRHLEFKSDSLAKSLNDITQLRIELNQTKVKYNELLTATNECLDKFASINFLGHQLIEIDTFELEKIARTLINDPCPNENLNGETDNICTNEFPFKQFFQLGSKTYLITMVNFTYEGHRFNSGKSIVFLFQIVDSELKLLDNLIIDECCTFGQGLQFLNNKFIMGKQSIALHLVGGSGGAGVSVGIDYLISFFNNKLYLVYQGMGDGINSNDQTSWSIKYSFIPSNNEIFDMNISKIILGNPHKKRIENTIYKLNQNMKYNHH